MRALRATWRQQALMLGAAVGLALTLVTPVAGGAAAAPAPVRPFGLLTCRPADGVRVCPGGLVGHRDLRVPSFDGVPLDADVVLPARGRGPFPLVVLLHGLGQTKVMWEGADHPDGQLDTVTLASDGWAVLAYTARGFGASCGTAVSRAQTPACAPADVELADQRYEVRDTQYLAGLLVDEGLVRPTIAVAGISYGGGQALELATLKNRMVLPSGQLVPFTSPGRHVAMRVGAVFALWGWEDLVSALVPNGSLPADSSPPPVLARVPVGVPKASWLHLLYQGLATGHLPPVGTDPSDDLTAWYHEILAGAPYGPAVRRALRLLQQDRSAVGIPLAAGGPAPTVLDNGWTDTLFPVSEALHYVNRIQAAGDDTPVLQLYDDEGHGWAQNRPGDTQAVVTAGINFLDAVVRHQGTPETGVEAFPTTCAPGTSSGPARSGVSLAALQQGAMELTGAAPQTVTSTGGDPVTAAALDPVDQPLCHALPAAAEPGTAAYARPVGAVAATLVGPVRISARLAVSGRFPQLVARLWDVAPDGTRQIVALGVFRPVRTGAVTFDLPPADWTFAAGHQVELELVGSNPPAIAASTGTFAVTVSGLQAEVPLA